MAKSELLSWLISQPFFKSEYEIVLTSSVLNQFASVKPAPGVVPGLPDWNYLLLCASLLSQSDHEHHQDMSLRIAQHCLNDSQTLKEQKDAAAVILDTLGNRVSIGLAEHRNLLSPGVVERLPGPLRMDWAYRAMDTSIALTPEKVVHANKFQRAFWDAANDTDWLSISAPTSAGKSFIMSHWLASYARSSHTFVVVYLVPTRALVHQVESDLRNRFEQDGLLQNVHLSSVPLPSSIKDGLGNVLVFTQERLQLLLAATNDGFRIDALIVDEAQKIGDGHRGVLLQSVIEASLASNPSMKLIFAAPMARNVELLLRGREAHPRSRAISTDAPMVNQNVVWVSHISGNPRKWNISLMGDVEQRALGSLDLLYSPTSTSKRLTFLAHAIGGNDGGNLIYVNGAADAEKAAKQLYGLLPDLTPEQLDEAAGLIELSKEMVHRDYLLATVLQRGIAFHYGNMPLLLKSEIERLFRKNVIKYLICTSTLLEGVNLPCRNVFVRGPRKGRTTPMKDADFWNLAGRAGRWGQEFQGNIVCIDPTDTHVWPVPPPVKKQKFTITRTSDEVLRQSDDLMEFIQSGTPRVKAIQQPELEYTFSYLVSAYLRFGSITNSPWGSSVFTENLEALQSLIGEISDNLKVPGEIVIRNPGISPLAMDSLLDYFEAERSNPGRFVPVPPESDDSPKHYAILLARINKTLGPIFGAPKRTFVLGLLLTNWLKGFPLSRLIAERLAYLKRTKQDANVAKVIRDTMADVEQVARFEAPKYIGCYIDVLAFHLKSLNREDLLVPIRDISLKLEYGITNKTQLSLISLGLSRTSAVNISEIIPSDVLSESECLLWLTRNAELYMDFPALVKMEIEQTLRQNPT